MKFNFLKSVRSVTCIVLTFALFFSSVWFNTANTIVKGAEDSVTITIINTNDVHGRSGSQYSKNILKNIGCDYIKNIKDSNTNSILIDAGDNTQGQAFASISKGSNSIEMMNAAGYDLATFGNHEFDYGLEQLKQNMKAAKFPFISANTVYKDSGKLVPEGINDSNGANLIIEKAGKKIGFFGITTTETAIKSLPKNIENITFKDEIEVSKEQVNILKQKGVDIIVGVMHVGIEAISDPTSHKIAEQVDGIDLIIDGHSHNKDNTEIKKENKKSTFVIQTGTSSENIGMTNISFSDSSYSVLPKVISVADIGKTYTPNDEVTKLYKQLEEKNKPALERVIAKTTSTLYSGSYNGIDICRNVETNLGNMVADAMYDGSKNLIKDTKYKDLPIVTFANGGAIRESIKSGYITYGDILSTLPFANVLSLKEITPDILYKVVEHSVSGLPSPEIPGKKSPSSDGKFPQISGMRIEFDPAKPVNDKVLCIYLKNSNGSETLLSKTDNSTKIVFASSDYQVAGGDGYDMLKTLPYIAETYLFTDLLESKLKELTLNNNGDYPFDNGRVNMVKDSSLYPDFDSKITLKSLGEVLSNTKVNIKIDRNNAQEFLTDSNGIITLNSLKSGEHEIFVEHNGLYEYGLVTDCGTTDNIDTRNLTIELSDRSQAEVKSVINIINQIPDTDKITVNDTYIIKFARLAYDSLKDDLKPQITNYNRLVKAENRSFLNIDPIIIKTLIIPGLILVSPALGIVGSAYSLTEIINKS